MISSAVIQEKYQKNCVVGWRFIVLIFGQPDMSEISSVKIIGKNDDWERASLIAADIGCVCLGVIELDKGQSAYIKTVSKNSRRKLEEILSKTIETYLRASI